MSSLDKENGPFARLVQTRQPRVSIRNAKQFRPRAGSLEVKRRKCMFMDGTVEFENETRTGTTQSRRTLILIPANQPLDLTNAQTQNGS